MGIPPSKLKASEGGIHLTPKEFHAIIDSNRTSSTPSLDNNGKDENSIVMIDCRNKYESDVGFFKSAIKPHMRNFSEWPSLADELIKDLNLR